MASAVVRARARFFNLVDLVNQLEQEKAAGRGGRLSVNLLRYDLIFIDELGHLPFSQHGGQLLFHLIGKLYENRSLLIITNLALAASIRFIGFAALNIPCTTCYVRRNLITSDTQRFMEASMRKQSREKKITSSSPGGLLATTARAAQFVTVSKARFEAVMKAAEQSGLLGEKSKRIGGRISPALIEQAKKHTGIETDTDLIEFALANVALDDNFGTTFRKTQGTVDPDLKLGF